MITLPLIFHRQMVLFLGLLLVAGALVACGGGMSSDSSDTGSNGDLVLSLTDAQGDFANYTVDVVSLTLTKANGAEVSTLPLATRVDFAQYTDITEFLTVATVASGIYVAATMVLDYTDADIWVENAVGELVQVENIVDENGDPLDQVEVTVQLEDRNRLVIAPGRPKHLQLDFDLKATNIVTFDDQGDPTVSVDPYLIADVDYVDGRRHRLRGLLDSVDTAGSSFSVIVRPFFAGLTGRHADFGRMTVTTGDQTLFELNGDMYEGQNGLAAMENLDPLCPMLVLGGLKFNPLRFEADQVFAGTSAFPGDQDMVSGTVVARSGNELTVKGATLVQRSGGIIFHDLVTVTLSETSRVTRQFSQDDFGIDDISVGQRITVFGIITDDDPLHLALDATQGYVRMRMTVVRGTVVATSPTDPVAQLSADLQSINRHHVASFDFSGTGADGSNDAAPSDYEINTGGLDLSSLTAGDPIKVRGFVQPFGAAPQDFNAWTIIDVTQVRAFLKVNWQPWSETAFDDISAAGLTLNLDGAGNRHHVFRAWLFTDLTTLEAAPVVAPRDSGNGVFILRLAGVDQVFVSFDEFIEDLASRLGDGWLVQKIWAEGDFDDAMATLNADLVDIHLK